MKPAATPGDAAPRATPRPWLTASLQGAALAAFAPTAARFAAACRAPEAAQGRRLRRLLAANATSAYGLAHGFAQLDSVRRYQDRVPIVTADDVAPLVARAAAGEAAVLTAEAPRAFERSSGSTAPSKLVPYTRGLLREFQAATQPWLFDVWRRCPRLLGTVAYFSISPISRPPGHTPGGIPIGLADDTEYFHPRVAWALRALLAVPGSVARLADVEGWRRATALHLLRAEHLGLLSVWSPTFLTLLMRYVEAHLDALLDELPSARRASIRARLDAAGALTGEALWPRLALVSCWMDGPSEGFAAELRRAFPRTPFQPKGLLATEGVVSVPLWRAEQGAVAAVASHFLEFLDVEARSRRPLLCHELRVGGCYSPLLSTGGGFYRYHLADVVRCTGRLGATPLLRFEGKLDRVVDLCGEKLNARHVGEALRAALAEVELVPSFAMLAPLHGAPPRYGLFLEGARCDATARAAAARLEAHLRENVHYDYCRRLGQLEALELRPVTGAWQRFERALAAEGAPLGAIKPTPLDHRAGWDAVLSAAGASGAGEGFKATRLGRSLEAAP